MYTAAAIINWMTMAVVGLATLGFGLIAAAWIAPMACFICKAAKDPYKHTALAVCTLLFATSFPAS